MSLNVDAHALTQIMAGGLLNSILAGLGIAALAWFLSRVAGRHSSAARFAVWFVALIGIALLPWVGFVGHSSGSMRPAPSSVAITLPESLAYYLLVVWAIGAALGLMHVAHGLYCLRRLRAKCIPVDADSLDSVLRASLGEMQMRRRVTLCTSEAVRVPAAIGYVRPLVFFPPWTLREIPTEELNAILLHELAHLRRYDDWTNLAQKVVKAILFFHPAVWFIESRLTLEREMACDDAVLATTYSPRAYAESLVSLAEKSFLRRGVQLAQAAVGHVQQLRLRLAEILRRDRIFHGRGSAGMARATVALMSFAAIVSVYGISREPRLVAFSSDVPRLASTVNPSQALSMPISSHRQPVSLRYTDHGVSMSSGSADQSRHVRTPRRVATKSSVILARSGGNNETAEETALPRILALSEFPIQITPAPVLVVLQGEQFGTNGPVLWRVTVVHLTPAQERAITGGFPKQI